MATKVLIETNLAIKLEMKIKKIAFKNTIHVLKVVYYLSHLTSLPSIRTR